MNTQSTMFASTETATDASLTQHSLFADPPAPHCPRCGKMMVQVDTYALFGRNQTTYRCTCRARVTVEL